MFDDNINKILGNTNPIDNMMGGNRMVPYGFGNRRNFNINPQNVISQIQKLLDKLPEVKNAKGSLTVEFVNGQKKTLQLSYTE